MAGKVEKMTGKDRMRTGTWNELKVDRIKDFGVYLTDGSEDVLLPRKQVPEGTKVGDTIKAFI